MITYERSTLDERRKLYWPGRSPSNDLGRGGGFLRQVDHGAILETKASTILEFLTGLRGTLLVTFEEGTWAAWLYDLLKPHVGRVLVCNPRKGRVALTRPSPEEVRVAREAELRAAARGYEAELLAIFDQLPKWNTTEGGQLRHHYWDGKKWVEYDLKNPPLWVVENIDPDSLTPPPR